MNGSRFVEYFVFLVLLFLVMFYVKRHYGEVEYVRSRIDGRTYLVRRLADNQRAADFLANINKDINTLIKHLMSTYPDNADIRRLYKNYSPETLSEGSNDNGYTSYSVNKGEKIILCLRQKDDNSFVNKNIVLYVTVHELAHLMTSDVGHTDSFWKNFRFILREAVNIGLYTKVDYAKEPVKYCGIKISSSVI